jgi:hypothetical protein
MDFWIVGIPALQLSINPKIHYSSYQIFSQNEQSASISYHFHPPLRNSPFCRAEIDAQ